MLLRRAWGLGFATASVQGHAAGVGSHPVAVLAPPPPGDGNEWSRVGAEPPHLECAGSGLLIARATKTVHTIPGAVAHANEPRFVATICGPCCEGPRRCLRRRGAGGARG